MLYLGHYKKFFLILGFLGISCAIGYLLWRLFFAPMALPGQPITEPGSNSGLPSAGSSSPQTIPEDKVGSLPQSITIPDTRPLAGAPDVIAIGGLTRTEPATDVPVLNPQSNLNGGLNYYNKNDGLFYKINAEGQVSLLSDKVFYNVEKITWAPNSEKAVLEYPDGSKIVYNFTTKKQVTLPNNWEEFSFSPDSSQLAAKSLALDPKNNWLIISADDGSQAKNLEKIGTNENKVYVSWSPNKQIAAMYTKGLDFNRQEVFFVGLNGENFKSTIVEGRGFESLWSKTGDRLLYSVYNSDNNLNPKLWIVDAQGDQISQNRGSIGLNTWASKCSFASNDEVYCAVPNSLERGAGLFPELADQSQDSLYRINLQTGVKELLAIPDGAYNISQIIVPGNDTLFFTDKQSGLLYKMRLR